MKNLVQVESIVKTFGGLKALNDCSLEIKENSITGIIGPNGSGKSTLFNVITGNLKPDSGRITYNGCEITNKESHDLFHQQPLPHARRPALLGTLFRARQLVDGAVHLWRGLPQLPPRVSARLPQRREAMAV